MQGWLQLGMDVLSEFLSSYRYKREFGFTIPSRDIIVDDIRVRGTGKACTHSPQHLPEATGEPKIEMVGKYTRLYVFYHIISVH